MNTFGVTLEQATKKAKEMLKQLDKNNSGSLNFSEYVIGTMHLSKVFTEELIERMFQEIDLNKDGKLSASEINSLISGIDCVHIFGQKKQIDLEYFKQLMTGLLSDSTKEK